MAVVLVMGAFADAVVAMDQDYPPLVLLTIQNVILPQLILRQPDQPQFH